MSDKSKTVICLKLHNFWSIEVSFLFLRSKVVPYRNSLKRVCQWSYPYVAPGLCWTTSYFVSSAATSDSSSLIFKYYFSYTAFALLIAGLIERRGLPSILSLSRSGNRLRRGSKLFRSLLDICKVLSLYSCRTLSGKVVNLLLCRSSTVNKGACYSPSTLVS